MDSLFKDDINNSPDPADMADIQNNLPAAPSASSIAARGSAEQSMDTSELGSGTGGSGGRANVIAGSSTSGMAKLMPNPRLKTMHLTYNKKWYHYTYRYAHSAIQGTTLTRVLTPYNMHYGVNTLVKVCNPVHKNSFSQISNL